MTDTGIRKATIDDAEQVARLVTELGYPTTSEAMKDRLSAILPDPGYATFVAERGGEVVGVAGGVLSWYYEKDGIYCRLAVLAVSSKVRGLGIGAQLVQAVESWAVRKDAREMFVNSGLHRTDAHRFYERHGYARTGLRFAKTLTTTR